MKHFLLIWADDVIRRSFKFFLCIEGIFLVVFGFVWSRLPPQLPLFYSLPRGNEQLANPLSFTILPIFSIIIMILNIILGILLYRSYPIVSRILILGGTLFTLLVFITFLKIIFTVI